MRFSAARRSSQPHWTPVAASTAFTARWTPVALATAWMASPSPLGGPL